MLEDGRRVRRARNRDAVVDGMLELFREGNLAPSSDEVAGRANLSPRSLFRYFDDIDDLCRAAITRQYARVRPLLDVDVAADAPFARRVAALVEQRLRLFDAMGPVGQIARIRSPFQPLVAAELTQARSLLRHQIKSLFAPELAALGAQRAASSLAAADVLCSYESYQLMRHDQALTRARCAVVLNDSLTELLT